MAARRGCRREHHRSHRAATAIGHAHGQVDAYRDQAPASRRRWFRMHARPGWPSPSSAQAAPLTEETIMPQFADAKGDYRGTTVRNDAELASWLGKRPREAALESDL